jgi:hypothetical protein
MTLLAAEVLFVELALALRSGQYTSRNWLPRDHTERWNSRNELNNKIMNMFWNEIEQNRNEGELDSVWAEIEQLNRKSNKSVRDYTQLEDLRNHAAELANNRSSERYRCCDESTFMGGFGMF